MRLTKHHGLGNDFLVLVDLDQRSTVDASIARAVCDRHRGVGADGLIVVSAGTNNPFRMTLFNEDGSRAELSGNGISCLAQALVREGLVTDSVGIDTDAGPRTVEVRNTLDAVTHEMRVAMGNPVLGDAMPEWESDLVIQAVGVDVGNPHLVCHVASLEVAPDLVAIGTQANAMIAGGINVELIAPGPTPGSLAMVVYERGVGPTEACGTGAVASAVAAAHFGLVGEITTVHQPGGPAVVELGSPAHLTVPVVAIADIEWPAV